MKSKAIQYSHIAAFCNIICHYNFEVLFRIFYAINKCCGNFWESQYRIKYFKK